MGLFAERLIAKLDASEGRWPLRGEREVWEALSLWIAFRESDRDRLKEAAGWTNLDRPYAVDPIPRKICHAFSQLLYGSALTVTAEADADQDKLDALERENNLAAELQRAEIVCSSEGEVWWRAFRDLEVSDVPLLEWYSRTAVLPLWAGAKLRAAAFISRYDVGETAAGNPTEVFRHFEVHDQGSVTNVLYRSARADALGQRVALDSLEDTMLLADQWVHGLPTMLCGRIPNLIGVDPTLGVSDFDGIQDLLHMVNEATSLQAENARLAGKYRSIVDESATDADGNFDASREIVIVQSANRGLGESGGDGPFKIMQYTYDAEQLIAHKRETVDTALSRVGIVPQYVGAGSVTEGLAVSGTSLRVRLLPTIAAGEERAQYHDDEVPRALGTLQMLDAMPVEAGGFGRSWVDPVSLPAVERGSTLPVDLTEEVARHADAVTAQIESRQTAIEDLHPDWPEERVKEELARIKDDQGSTLVNRFGAGDGAVVPTNGAVMPEEQQLIDAGMTPAQAAAAVAGQ